MVSQITGKPHCFSSSLSKLKRIEQQSANTALCEVIPPVTGGFPSQSTGNTYSVSMPSRRYGHRTITYQNERQLSCWIHNFALIQHHSARQVDLIRSVIQDNIKFGSNTILHTVQQCERQTFDWAWNWRTTNLKANYGAPFASFEEKMKRFIRNTV